MNPIKRLGVITAVALTMDALTMAPAFPVPQADPKLAAPRPTHCRPT